MHVTVRYTVVVTQLCTCEALVTHARCVCVAVHAACVGKLHCIIGFVLSAWEMHLWEHTLGEIVCENMTDNHLHYFYAIKFR